MTRAIPLGPRPVADFYRAVMTTLSEIGLPVRIWSMPVEIASPIRFEEDTVHPAYDPVYANRFWRILLEVERVYAVPEPPGFTDVRVQPDAAVYNAEFGEFFLPYDAVCRSSSPEQTLLSFVESTYEAGATLAGWDRTALER